VKVALVSLGLVLLVFSQRVGAESKWAVHEWGTFTSLQDEAGKAIGGIDTDDEPVPPFVHQLASYILLRPTEIPSIFFQGAPSCHPDVTMRLETPVIYFHPPGRLTNPAAANVTVKFRGGWLTEFYPSANPGAPGLSNRWSQFPHLYSRTESKLEWDDLKLGGDWPITNTSAHVWLSPRAVQTALVQTTSGESEKFLFYRGVAHINAPLKISRHCEELIFRSQLEELPADQPLAIRSLWLVDIHADGKIAFRSLPGLMLDADASKILTHTPASFDSSEFSSGNLDKLKASLQVALISEGLFADEAQALLNTWELSYFKSAGLRVFFLVPRAWTDFYLPLEISMPAEINRVMVGRIELVTPEQRERLRRIAHFAPPEIEQGRGQMMTNFYASPAVNPREWELLASGQKRLAAFISVPKTYQTYLDLGRFRNALILDQAQRFSSAGLTNFIAMYRLEPYLPVDIPVP
jgi:hypothetical protein